MHFIHSIAIMSPMASLGARIWSAVCDFFFGRGSRSTHGRFPATLRVCECGACLEGLSAADRRSHLRSLRHSRNLQLLHRSTIYCAENFSEYRNCIKRFVKPDDSVLEVGCHQGVTTDRLSRSCRHVIGVDHSKTVLALGRARFPKLDLREVDARDLSTLRSCGNFDKVFIDINGSRELQTLLPLIEAYERVLQPSMIIVKNARLKRLLLRCHLVHE